MSSGAGPLCARCGPDGGEGMRSRVSETHQIAAWRSCPTVSGMVRSASGGAMLASATSATAAAARIVPSARRSRNPSAVGRLAPVGQAQQSRCCDGAGIRRLVRNQDECQHMSQVVRGVYAYADFQHGTFAVRHRHVRRTRRPHGRRADDLRQDRPGAGQPVGDVGDADTMEVALRLYRRSVGPTARLEERARQAPATGLRAGS